MYNDHDAAAQCAGNNGSWRIEIHRPAGSASAGK
jgi:hypothetical protein